MTYLDKAASPAASTRGLAAYLIASVSLALLLGCGGSMPSFSGYFGQTAKKAIAQQDTQAPVAQDDSSTEDIHEDPQGDTTESEQEPASEELAGESPAEGNASSTADSENDSDVDSSGEQIEVDGFASEFPHRKNPFTFMVDLSGKEAPVVGAGKMPIKLTGIVGSGANRRAVIQAGDDYHTIQAGEQWGAIRVLDISSTEARVEIDGVSNLVSLIDRPKDDIQ